MGWKGDRQGPLPLPHVRSRSQARVQAHRRRLAAHPHRGARPNAPNALGRPPSSARQERAFAFRQARRPAEKWPAARSSRSARRAPCSNQRTRPLGRSLRIERHAALDLALCAEQAGERPRRAPRQSTVSGASSAICTRTARISARSRSSRASRSTSATIAARARRRVAASRKAVRTASESLSPPLLRTLRAAAELSSSRT